MSEPTDDEVKQWMDDNVHHHMKYDPEDGTDFLDVEGLTSAALRHFKRRFEAGKSYGTLFRSIAGTIESPW
jgi:hypothetical protein